MSIFKKYHPMNLSWINSSFLTLTPVFSVLFSALWLYYDDFDYRIILLGLGFYIASGISITAGYHRLFSHRTYEAHPVVKLLFLVFGAAAFQNSALKWSSDHRLHHLEVDTDKDPYNINEGFFYAHMGWVMLKEQADKPANRYVKDLLNDKMVMWQHKYYFTIAVVFGLFVPSLLGALLFDSLLGGIAIAALAKVVILHHSTFFINSLCHYIGKTPYTRDNTAKDSWLMALLTFGEGYHNFHHYFQADYRNGIKWFQFDPTKWLIKCLEWLKLAKKLKKTPEFKIYKAKLQMKLEELKEKYKLSDDYIHELEQIKERVIQSLTHLEETKAMYAKALKSRIESQETLILLKRKILLAKEEFRYNYQTFNVMLDPKYLLN